MVLDKRTTGGEPAAPEPTRALRVAASACLLRALVGGADAARFSEQWAAEVRPNVAGAVDSRWAADRFPRYARLLARAPRDGTLRSSLTQAALAIGLGLFFEAHEILEDPWRQETGTVRTQLQGIIQIAAGFHHLGAGRRASAVKLLSAGRDKLARAAPALAEFPVLELRDTVDRWLRWLESASESPRPEEPLCTTWAGQ